MQAIRECGRPVIAAVEGVCVGAGAVLALAADIRFASLSARTAFLFARMGLSGCDMGAGALLPRLIGEGRARELLFSGRTLSIEEGLSWGFYNRVLPAEELLSTAIEYAQELAAGPTFAHKVTKETLNREWTMTLAEALEAEARAQAQALDDERQRREAQRARDERGRTCSKASMTSRGLGHDAGRRSTTPPISSTATAPASTHKSAYERPGYFW
mgnify:CR=1 FL=1